MPDILFSIDNILKLSEIMSILAGGGLVAFKLGRTTTRVEATLEMQNAILRTQSSEITELKLETKKLGDVLTQIAVQSVRIGHIEDDLRDMRHKKERAATAA